MGDFDDDMPQIQAHNEVAEEAPSGALPQAPGNTSADPMGEIMVAAGPSAPEIARTATRYGITEGDPAWILAVADRAAGRIEAVAQGIGDMVFRQAQRAGPDIAAAAGQAIEGKTIEAGQAIVAVI